MNIRKLASIEKISALKPFPGVQSLQIATVLKQPVFVLRGEFEAGALCCYFKVGSLIPTDGSIPRTSDGKRAFHVRPVQVNGQMSFGIALPPQLVDRLRPLLPLAEGTDVTALLGIQDGEQDVLARQEESKAPEPRRALKSSRPLR